MNFLFDIGHPAHVHLFRNYILYLKNRGHKVYVVSRKKDVTAALLDHYGIEHFPITQPSLTKSGMLKELMKRNNFIFNLHKKIGFNSSFGTSASIGFLKLKYNVPAFNFNEDDDYVVKLYSFLAYPCSTKIFNPDCVKFSKWKSKRVLYPSYHELAYLHPDNFISDPTVATSYGLEPFKYVIIRLSALQAHHDSGIKGIKEDLLEKIKETSSSLRVIFSTELNENNMIKPWDMHQIMAHAKMVISDSQTMTAEAAVLGRPSVRINDFVGRISYLEELEHEYGLTLGFKPDQRNSIIEGIKKLLSDNNTEAVWLKRRERLLSEKLELTGWMIKYFGY